MVVEQDIESGDVTIYNGYNRSLTLSDGQARTLVKFLIGALYGHDQTKPRKIALQEVASAYAEQTPRTTRLQAAA